MNIQKTEQLITELLDKPLCPLGDEQKRLTYEYAVGLFVGHLDDLRADCELTIQQLQGMHTLSQVQTFYVGYFIQDETGRADAAALGLDGVGPGEIAAALLDIQGMHRRCLPDQRKEASERSVSWAKTKLVEQLAIGQEENVEYQPREHVVVNYDPSMLLGKAEAVQAYNRFYREALWGIGSEPDDLLADAKRALIHIHLGRLNTMAAVDVFPGLLALEEQITRSAPSPQMIEWMGRLGAVAPAIGDLHNLEGPVRVQARELYTKHLDAIRQGAPFELDDVDEQEAIIFGRQALDDLVAAMGQSPNAFEPTEPTALALELQGIQWEAPQIKQLMEAVLAQWDMLSEHQAVWQQVDDRNGFAQDEKYQVVITPRRNNMSVDSTRRIVNIPEGIVRSLTSQYPAGVLPLVAHELSHVLQGYADLELGQQIPLARIKGRRYRILREAGGSYQEKILARDYLGCAKGINYHYLRAYVAKANGANRLEVARVFYDYLTDGKQLDPAEDQAVRELAVNRTSRLYRYGGQNSQVLDYVEQSVVCEVLLQCLAPEQVDAFLLGSASFSLEDSALLHRFGLLTLPARAAFSPAHDVMRVFLGQ
jgi:hypothetical protein